jgi:hypothetical protein
MVWVGFVMFYGGFLAYVDCTIAKELVLSCAAIYLGRGACSPRLFVRVLRRSCMRLAAQTIQMLGRLPWF